MDGIRSKDELLSGSALRTDASDLIGLSDPMMVG
jgi:hypothetical protein